MRLLGETVGSVSLIPMRRPIELDAREPMLRIPDYRNAFAIRLPSGWYCAPIERGLSMAQMNYLTGDQAEQNATAKVDQARPKGTAETAAKIYLWQTLSSIANKGFKAKTVAEGPAGMGGMDGYQFVIRLQQGMPAASQRLTPPAQPLQSRKFQQSPVRPRRLKASWLWNSSFTASSARRMDTAWREGAIRWCLTAMAGMSNQPRL